MKFRNNRGEKTCKKVYREIILDSREEAQKATDVGVEFPNKIETQRSVFYTPDNDVMFC